MLTSLAPCASYEKQRTIIEKYCPPICMGVMQVTVFIKQTIIKSNFNQTGVYTVIIKTI